MTPRFATISAISHQIGKASVAPCHGLMKNTWSGWARLDVSLN